VGVLARRTWSQWGDGSPSGSARIGSILLISGFLVGVALTGVLALPLHSAHHGGSSAAAPPIVPAQGDQLYTFSSCTAPDGSSCLSPYGGIDVPLAVGTIVSLEFFTSAFCTTPITGNVNWGDSSTPQAETIPTGPCECEFGPFTHTFNSAGDFNAVIYDTCDGSESLGTISVSGVGDLFSFDSLLLIFGAILGLAAVIGGLVSLRGVRSPPGSITVPGSASIEPVKFGYLSNSPVGPRSETVATSMEIPPPNALPGRFPEWATDYRTTPYQPNPLIQGWAEYLQKYQAWLAGKAPVPPNWPALTNSAPPTSFPGTFCQARINPQTGQWAWWNPIDGTFPWG